LRSRLTCTMPLKLFFLSAVMIVLGGCGPISHEDTSNLRPSPRATDSAIVVSAKETCASVSLPKEIALAEETLFKLINKERGKKNIPPLKRSCRLDEVARRYSREMSETKAVKHVSAKSGDPGDRARTANIPFAILTENLAMAPDVLLAHHGFMNSPNHKANILDQRVSYMGVGVRIMHKPNESTLYVTQMFMAQLPKINADNLANEIFDKFNQKRKDNGLSPLNRLPWLDTLAGTRLANCFEDKDLPKVSLKSAPVCELKGTVFYLQGIIDASDVVNSKEMQIKNNQYTHLGLAVIQGTHPTMGEKTICIKVLFGKKN